MVLPTFIEMEDELPDAILTYFEPVCIGVRARNGRRVELKRALDLTKKDPVHSIRGDEIKRHSRYEDNNMRILRFLGVQLQTFRHFYLELRTIYDITILVNIVVFYTFFLHFKIVLQV